jgi:putative transposase
LFLPQPLSCGRIEPPIARCPLAPDGTKIERECITARYADRLAVAQRAGRTQRVRAIQTKIKNVRKDFLHRLSHALVTKYQRIVVGNVNSAGLAKTRLAKSVLDVGWSMLRGFLAYKAIRHRATYEQRDERWSTQRCSECGSLGGPKGIAALGVREWFALTAVFSTIVIPMLQATYFRAGTSASS